MNKSSDDKYSEQQTVERRDAVIKRMLAMPPKPHSEMKVAKSRRKVGKSPKGVPTQSKKPKPAKQGRM
jgi:hypothetical protein